MLSYLQDRRPKRRRSANLLSAFLGPSADDQKRSGEENGPGETSLSNGSRRSSTKDTPSSPRGQPFLQLPRIASSHGKSADMHEAEQRRHWSFKGDTPQMNRPPGSSHLPRPPLSASATFSNSGQSPALQPFNQPNSSLNRNKRPIDLRFDQMKAYSAAPFHQSIYNQPLQPHIIPQPTNPPTPPPKSAPAPSQRSGEPDLSDEATPTLSRPSTRHNRRPDRWHSTLQRQPSTQALNAQDQTNQEQTSNQQRYSKSKLNLMNPMSLLARRRSYKPAEKITQEQLTPAPKLPDDYDPRIRGKVVHDFSAPRSSRPQTSKQEQDDVRETIKVVPQDLGAEKQHTPVFKEEFDDGLVNSQDPGTRPEAFMRTAAAQASQPDPDTLQLPKFARKLPSKIETESHTSKSTSRRTSGGLDILVESPDRNQTPAVPSPSLSPPRANSTSASISETTLPGLGSPKRYKSDASRFSFDLAGVGSAAQEKLLEDKHREKVQQTERQSVLSIGSADAEEDSYLNFDDEDDGIEERIPGVNCDHDEFVGNQMPVLRRDMDAFQFASPNKSSFDSTASPVSTGVTSLDTPYLGVPWLSTAASKSSPNLLPLTPSDSQQPGILPEQTRPHSDSDAPLTPSNEQTSNVLTNLTFDHPRQGSVSDDDMYFDDGMIDEVGDVSDLDDFDENVFDDSGHGLYGLPLRDRTLKPLDEAQPPHHPDHQEHRAPSKETLEEQDNNLHRSLSSGGASNELQDALTELGQPNTRPFSQDAGLTHDNLAAYNRNSLLSAVNQAAVDGAFGRTSSIQTQQPPQLELTVPGGQNDSLHDGDFHLGDDGFDSNDGLDDEDIVAAANAEALENDDDGFYGQEFGFFARASKGDEGDELVNGGYFGARGITDGIKRSHSGKVDFQEPSLTPITERSEFSNRNSTISLAQLHHAHAFAAPSPGLDMRLDDVNMQLAMLKQLRKGAWGGSDASLHSSSGSQHSGSPMTYVPPHGMALSNSASNLQNMASFQSISSGRPSSNDSGASPESDSPTITLPIQQPPAPAVAPIAPTNRQPSSSMPPPLIPASAMRSPTLPSPTARSGFRSAHGKTHSRNSSGGESISYKEEGGKWIMEKRRMSETGETMMVGRSVLEAGAI